MSPSALSNGSSAETGAAIPRGRRSADIVVPALFVVSLALALVAALLGPSVSETPIAHGGAAPPYFFDAHPSPWLVTALLAGCFAVGAAMLLVALRALRSGWEPNVRRIVAMGAIGTVAFLLVPTIGSSDFTNYSSYGHTANRGLDEYVVTPIEASKLGVPTAEAVEPPWQSTISVYGPLAVKVEQLAAWLGGPSLRRTAWWLSLIHCLAYLGTGALLLGMAPTDSYRRRSAILWCANPLMIYELVGGSHVDSLLMLVAIGALALLRRSRFAAGAVVGLGLAMKVTAALTGAAMAWVDRRSPRRLLALAAGAGVVTAAFYLTASPHVLDQTRRAGKFVSPATPWWFFIHRLNSIMSHDAAHVVTTVGVIILTVVLARAIFRIVPPQTDDTGAAVRTTMAYSVAWLMGAPYLLPWYDALGWATLPLVDESPLDELFVLHTTVLAFAFLPGRDLPRSGAFESVITGLHSYLSPVVLAGLAVALILAGRRRIGAAADPVTAPAGTVGE